VTGLLLATSSYLLLGRIALPNLLPPKNPLACSYTA
jgi:hypothetical protein